MGKKQGNKIHAAEFEPYFVCVCINRRAKKDTKNGLRIKVYSPYLLLNKSAHDVAVRCRDSNYGYKAVTSMHSIPAYESVVYYDMTTVRIVACAN